ncbi:UDP-N-acetylmuramate:L-alanyl-gamma-D-glutamyl-meso-diaminopimelate ligase [Gammaproteobacteria bacterium]|nr:UDP-N-acetylmuramate:L-alanyl-gamma-D-glutamyl-meso-diaminopimelate ligase [Gammaproteobacteria bacterium]MDA8798564.1 UDP-N-acetylmuramate:L-alanyl-gamma-D-glutamyl-meso-diaminopimelate ligase [Gammaproteobacteria bacterium]MDA9936658.1 UDP-N-acetylmuramate:L-alanyl-gamma-D-glutamyl-meso-diaminopimelate ligase [Gammaproteobacteria bacterium]MDA9965412.1 UDP-N-acetylmuramate:L-alanyl-gamma-D-glutamyl-meso-diaminopimelate ligase [Gammaproteobacteria bacterium]MDB0010138.1 UDP-N-acetylmuramate
MKIHILGICGTFMGGLAQILVEKGHIVSGSDKQFYPPMSDQLKSLGVQMIEGYEESDLPCADLYVIGNALSRGNPSVEYILNQRLEYTSGPRMLGEMIRDRTVIAVSGTHGKTSTSFLICEIFQSQGIDIGFLVGGVSDSFNNSARLGSSQYFVIEADEYDSAFFDKRSKFIHYHPKTFIINNIEFDHADIFNDLSDILKQFHHAVRTVPANGNIIFHDGEKNITDLIKMGCWSKTHQLGRKENIQLLIEEGVIDFENQKFNISDLPMHGKHNLSNAVIAMYAASLHGISPKDSFLALKNSKGVKRRFETVFQNGHKIVIDDFAHHPTAISNTVQAATNYFPSKRILGIIELASNTMSQGHHGEDLYESASALGKAYWLNLSSQKNKEFEYDSIKLLLTDLEKDIDNFDVILIMSNKDSKKISEPIIDLIKNK